MRAAGSCSDHATRTLIDYLQDHAKTQPDHAALVFEGDRISYLDLRQKVMTCARALMAAGVKKGDRVAVLSPPRPEFWVLFLATVHIGGIWAGLNPKYRYAELDYVLEDTAPVILFAIEGFEGRSYADDIRHLLSRHPSIVQLVALTGAIDGATPHAAFLARATERTERALEARAASVEIFDPALIVYTSGTTGQPKGALLSHYGLSWGSWLAASRYGVPRPRMICSFPINHVASTIDTCGMILAAGGTVIFHERFDPVRTLATMESERVSIWGGVPTMIQMCLNHEAFEGYDLSSVELVLWGGAALPESAVATLCGLGKRLKTAFGMTETHAHVTYTDDDADLDVLANTIGRPDPECDCRIADDAGMPCGIETHGELQFRGPFLMLGYHNRPDQTAAAFTADGWFRTGDIGYRRRDGNISLVGRRSDMFKSGGYNVYPREVEVLLEAHPSVAQAAIVAMPDDLYQEVGYAAIVVNEGKRVSADQLRRYCQEAVSNYKVPKQFFFLASLPLLAVGKVDKKALKQLFLSGGH